ncbi:MAG: MlaD family protein [Planctomycetota bacterium]|jgi:paraquat-inducible protein B
MGTKPSYFKTGLFVITAGLLILAAVIVFGSGLFAQDKTYFESYFDESLSGLSVGSPVELRGVRIGQVEKVTFIRNEYGASVGDSDMPKYEHYVMVVCSILHENLPEVSSGQSTARLNDMISRGLRLQLTTNLLTGQAYLLGDYFDPNRYQPLDIGWEPKHLYVPSAPAAITTLRESVDEILLRLQELDMEKLVAAVESVLASIDKALADANVGDISRDFRALLADTRRQVNDLDTNKLSMAARQTLTSVDQAVADANIPALSRELQSLVEGVAQTNEHLQKLLASPEPIFAPANLPEVIARLNKTLGRIDRLVSSEEPQIEMILANFKEISENLKDLTANLKQHPSDLLIGKPPSQSEALK